MSFQWKIMKLRIFQPGRVWWNLGDASNIHVLQPPKYNLWLHETKLGADPLLNRIDGIKGEFTTENPIFDGENHDFL